MKKIFCILFLSFLLVSSAFSLEECYKLISKDADTVFIGALRAIVSSNDCHLVEYQSENGYILFSYNAKYYLITVTKRYQNQTEIKILPQNSEFDNDNNPIPKVFAMIESRLKIPMEPVK